MRVILTDGSEFEYSMPLWCIHFNNVLRNRPHFKRLATGIDPNGIVSLFVFTSETNANRAILTSGVPDSTAIMVSGMADLKEYLSDMLANGVSHVIFDGGNQDNPNGFICSIRELRDSFGA